MKIYKAYKFRMYPKIEERIIINSFLGASRFIYNYFLNKKDELYKSTKENYNLNDMKKDVKNLHNEYPWLEGIDSIILRTTLEDLDRAYTNFFEKRASHPKFKCKNNHDTYRTVCIRSIRNGKEYSNIKVDLKNRMIKLPKLNEIKIRGYRKLKEFDKKIVNATVSKVAGKYYVSVVCEEEVENLLVKTQKVVGIDIGVKNIITTSDGEKIKTSSIKKYEKRLEKLNQKLARQKIGSKNFLKTKVMIQRVYEKIRNTRKYYTHKITSKLAYEYDMVVCETLKVKEMIENNTKTLKKNIINSTFYEIVRQITYKMKWKGKKLVNINTYYPSSQICSHCGSKNKEVKDLSVRVYDCPNCGYKLDRDINASINILWEGICKMLKEKKCI